jgi:hypothetical protein
MARPRSERVHFDATYRSLIAMASVTLRMESSDVGTLDSAAGARPLAFKVTLVEGHQETSDTVQQAAFTSGPWTCSFGSTFRSAEPSTDIITRLVTAQGPERNHEDFVSIGQTLYGWLFPAGPVRKRWDELVRTEPAPPSVVLEIRHAELARLPWELARGPAPANLRIALTGSVTRRHASDRTATRCSPRPLRILFVIGCSEAEEARLGVDIELDKIERTFVPLGRSVDVQCLRRPTRPELSAHVATYHPQVFHFAGHGGVDPLTQRLGLLFDAGGAGTWIWNAVDIPTDLLSWDWTPKFAFLNACRSGLDHWAAQGVQQGFLAAGTDVVLAMQADISGALAGEFAADVYRRCLNGDSVEAAVSGGRQKLIPNGSSYVDWSLPVLSESSAETRLFVPAELRSDPGFDQCGEFEHAKFFADCKEGRRLFTYWLNPPAPSLQGLPQKNVALLTGQPRSGKSHLLKWCMESWALSGAHVRYVEVHGGQAKTFLSILRQIRDGDSDGTDATTLLHGPLKEAAFQRFNWELKNYIDKGQAGEWNELQHGSLDVRDDGRPLGALGENRIEDKVCASFLDALRAAAAHTSTILVFDRFSGPSGERLLPASESAHLVNYLFRPIALDPKSNVKLVFVVNQGQQIEFGLNRIPPDRVLNWNLPVEYPREQLAKLAAEMLWLDDPQHERWRWVTGLTTHILDMPSDPDAPQGLAFLQLVYVMIELRKRGLLANVGRMR